MTLRGVVKADPVPGVYVDHRHSSCRDCEGACLWRHARGATIALPGAAHFRPGEEVLLALPARFVVLAALLTHGLPWAALLLGAWLGAWLTGSDGGALGGAVLGIATAWAVGGRLSERLDRLALSSLELRAAK